MDLVLARVDPFGTPFLQYATYFGGNAEEPRGNSSDLHVNANGVLTFFTDTDSTDMPTTGNAWQSAFAGGLADAVVTRFDPNAVGNEVVYCTYFGSAGFENGNAMDVAGDVVAIAGFTDSVALPTGLVGNPPAVQRFKRRAHDAYLAVLDLAAPAVAQVRYCTYYGGAGSDGANDLVLDAGGHVTLTGPTGSGNLTTTAGSFMPQWTGVIAHAYVARIDPQQGRLLYASYLGDPSGGTAGSLAHADGLGGVVVAGNTQAPGLPVTLGSAMAGDDWFVARFNQLPDGAARCGDATASASGRSFIGITGRPLSGNLVGITAGGAPQSSCTVLGALLLSSGVDCAGVTVPGLPTLHLTLPVPLALSANPAAGRAEVTLPLAGVPAGARVGFQYAWFAPCEAEPLSTTNALEMTVQ